MVAVQPQACCGHQMARICSRPSDRSRLIAAHSLADLDQLAYCCTAHCKVAPITFFTCCHLPWSALTSTPNQCRMTAASWPAQLNMRLDNPQPLVSRIAILQHDSVSDCLACTGGGSLLGSANLEVEA